MAKVAVILANGFEEIEALTVVDVLRRANISCDMVGFEEQAAPARRPPDAHHHPCAAGWPRGGLGDRVAGSLGRAAPAYRPVAAPGDRGMGARGRLP